MLQGVNPTNDRFRHATCTYLLPLANRGSSRAVVFGSKAKGCTAWATRASFLGSCFVDHTRAVPPTRERNNLMVAPRKMTKVFCTVVRVPAQGERTSQRLNRPSDLLPWADPYIARLVQNLQQEVRYERSTAPGGWRSTTPLQAELEPPSPMPESDWDWKEEPRWTFSEETPG
jgi:hypothetical protein